MQELATWLCHATVTTRVSAVGGCSLGFRDGDLMQKAVLIIMYILVQVSPSSPMVVMKDGFRVIRFSLVELPYCVLTLKFKVNLGGPDFDCP